jgi:tRNA dimethylallyltransferase
VTPAINLAIVGPTASGKTSLAVALARRHQDIELVSIDAKAVYRHLDIGTAKPTPDERHGLRWHLIDLVDPDEEFSVADFQRAFLSVRSEIDGRANGAIYVGGTGLYHRAAVDGLELAGRYEHISTELEQRATSPSGLAKLYEQLRALDPIAASRIECTNRRRLVRALEVTLGSGRPFSSFGTGMTDYRPTSTALVGLVISRELLSQRITERLDAQFDAGLLDEVALLLRDYGPLSRTAGQALAYRELLDHLDGGCSLSEARSLILSRTRRFARRQEAWFRRDPRVIWLDALAPDLVDQVDQLVFTATDQPKRAQQPELS